MKLTQTHKIIVALLLTLALLPFLWISMYAFPTSDDFCNAILNSRATVWERISGTYYNWTGRYTPASMGKIAIYAVQNLLLYKFLPIARILILIVLTSWVLRNLLNFSKYISLAFAAFSISIFLSEMPDVGQGIYWLTGARVYTLGIILSLLYISLILKYLQSTKNQTSKIKLIFIGSILILAMGCNESISLILLGFHILLLLFSEHKKNKSLLAFSIITLLALIISFTAPGNFARTSFITKPSFLNLTTHSIIQTLTYTFRWITCPLIIFGFLSSFIFGNFNSFTAQKNAILQSFPFWIIPIIALGIVFTGIGPSVFGVGGIGSERMLNPAFFYFTFFIILVGIQLGIYFKNRFSRVKEKHFKIILLIGFILFLFSKNTHPILKDLHSGAFQNFSKNVIEQKECIVQNTSDRARCSKKFTVPKTFNYYKILSPENLWESNCMTKFYLENAHK